MAEQSNRDTLNRTIDDGVMSGSAATAGAAAALLRQSHRNAQTARQLSREALLQWEKAVNGILAVPAAIALTSAANALYVAAFIERGFEAFQASAEAVGRELEHQMKGYVRASNGDWASSRDSSRPQS